MPRFDFSQNIPKMVPASKLDDIEQSMLNTFNQNDNITDYNGSGDESDNEKVVSEDEKSNYSDDESIDCDEIHENFQNEIYDYINNLEEIDIKYLLDIILKKRNLDIFYKKDFPKINLSPKEELIKMISYNIESNVNIYSFIFTFITLFALNKQTTSPLTFDIKFYMEYYNHLLKNKKINDNVFINIKKIDIPKLSNSDKNKKLNTRKKFNAGIADISVGIYALKVKILKYKKDQNKFNKNIKECKEISVKHKSHLKNILKEIDLVEKEIDEELRNEQIKNLYKKLKENNEINNINNEGNNICKLITKLENQKVDKLYILADIGKELIDQKIENEFKFLEQFKDYDIYYIYDLKSKNKISRFINMCNKLYLLKNKINLESIIKNNLLTSIRDLSQNNFTYLLKMF